MTTENIKESNYDKLNKALELNLSWICFLADQYYGTPEHIIKLDDIDTLWTLREREIFFRDALRTLNNFSLQESLNGSWLILNYIKEVAYDYLKRRSGLLKTSLLQTLQGNFLNITKKELMGVIKTLENNEDFIVKNGLIMNRNLIDIGYLELVENDKRKDKKWNTGPENYLK